MFIARSRHLKLPPAVATAAFALALSACGDARKSATDADVAIDTIGDTIVVRTLSGSVWGGDATLVPEVSIGELDGPDEYLFGNVTSIAVDDDRTVYVFDGQAQHIRIFDSAGTYIRTLGRPGEGPGEFARAEAVAVLPDDRVVVRDAGDKNIQVFGPGPADTDQWPYTMSGVMSYTNTPLYTDSRGRTYQEISKVEMASGRSRPVLVDEIVVLGPDGTHLDTLPDPWGDGLIWASLETESFTVENERHDADDPASSPVRWRSGLRYDVFEADGTYRGAVEPPTGFSGYPTPVFDGDHVWATTRDELGVGRVVRFRIEVGEAPEG